MVPMIMIHGVPFITITILHQGKEMVLDNVMVDTGSTNSSIRTEILEEIGLVALRKDRIRMVHGIGGVESVVIKTIDRIQVGDYVVESFPVLMSALDYGITINAMIGSDFLLKVGATLNFKILQLV